MSSKAQKALIAAIDQMEQLPGIAGVFSEVRLQIFHREPMRRDDWSYITSSGWLYVNPQRQATAAAVFRRSAMVDPKGAARRSGCAGSTGLHLPSGRACKGVVYFELSFAWRNRRAISAGDRRHGTYTHGHPYCGSFLPYGRDLYQPACGSVCGGVALCAGTRISACCAAP